jgi:hypothetical protein
VDVVPICVKDHFVTLRLSYRQAALEQKQADRTGKKKDGKK